MLLAYFAGRENHPDKPGKNTDPYVGVRIDTWREAGLHKAGGVPVTPEEASALADREKVADEAARRLLEKEGHNVHGGSCGACTTEAQWRVALYGGEIEDVLSEVKRQAKLLAAKGLCSLKISAIHASRLQAAKWLMPYISERGASS